MTLPGSLFYGSGGDTGIAPLRRYDVLDASICARPNSTDPKCLRHGFLWPTYSNQTKNRHIGGSLFGGDTGTRTPDLLHAMQAL